MAREKFHASVQYNDLTGSTAADNHDMHAMSDYLQEKGLIEDGEMVIGIEMWSGEVHAKTQDEPVSVTAVVTTPGGEFETIDAALKAGKLRVRKVEFEMALNEFFGLFKRFKIAISGHGLLEGREIDVAG